MAKATCPRCRKKADKLFQAGSVRICESCKNDLKLAVDGIHPGSVTAANHKIREVR